MPPEGRTGKGRMIRWVERVRQTSLSERILAGLVLGIAAGLFFGERTLHLQWIADVWIGLMQMTVLPYVIVSLIGGLAQLDGRLAKRLALRGGILLGLFWLIAFVVIAALPLAFPDYRNPAFVSAYGPEPAALFDPIELYIPANPFYSMANTIIPAVVLFSSAVGIAMIDMRNKTALVESLNAFIEALTRVTHFIVGLTPIGLFAIVAVSAGTMTWEEVERLEVYFVSYIVAALFLSFWVLPGLIAATTPFGYREVFRRSRDALLTAFLTQNLFIILPMLVETSRELFRAHRLRSPEVDSLSEVIVPITFNFPNAGKLLSLLFVPFAAWLAGVAMEPSSYPGFLLAGLGSYFAKAQVALPFLLDMQRIPQDLFQVYLASGVINGKFDTLAASMNLLAFSLIGTAWLTGCARFSATRLLRFSAVSLLALFVLVLGTRQFLAVTVDTSYNRDKVFRSMNLINPSVPMEVRAERPAPDARATDRQAGDAVLDQVRARGVLRAGYFPDRLPFTYFNDAGQLVGFDVELLNLLAAEMELRLEWVPVSWDTLRQQVNSGEVDIVGTMPLSTRMLIDLDLSDPYLQGTLGLVVRDHRRAEFATRRRILAQDALHIAYTQPVEYIRGAVEAAFPGKDFRWTEIPDLNAFFDPAGSTLDALLVEVEIGTAWSLLHPEYTVVVPPSSVLKMPSGFAVAKGQHTLAALLGRWIAAKRATGEIQTAYDYWILGKGAEKKPPRWSIGRDVLGWLED